MNTVVEVENLRAYYATQAYGVERTVRAVDGVSARIGEDEVFGIAGESGCGKSTLLKVLLGMIVPPLVVRGGSVRYTFDGHLVDALEMSAEDYEQVRWKQISYIPQGSMHVLNPVRRIRHTFRDFVSAHTDMPPREADELVAGYLADLGLRPQVLNAYPHQLSGGMRQRVTIALATVLSPRVIFADEPTTALDVLVQRGVLQLLEDIREREGSSIVLVTHDMGVHANIADRVAILYAGTIVEEAITRTIFREPLNPYTQYLIKSLPKMGDRTERVSIPGRPPALDHPPSGCRFHPRCPSAMAICSETAPGVTDVGSGHHVACFLVSGKDSHATTA